MQSDGSYLQAYICQLAVDSDHQVIDAVGVSNQPPTWSIWSPCCSEDNANACADQGIDAYIATGRRRRRNADTKTRMARKLRSKRGSKSYALRAKQLMDEAESPAKCAKAAR